MALPSLLSLSIKAIEHIKYMSQLRTFPRESIPNVNRQIKSRFRKEKEGLLSRVETVEILFSEETFSSGERHVLELRAVNDPKSVYSNGQLTCVPHTIVACIDGNGDHGQYYCPYSDSIVDLAENFLRDYTREQKNSFYEALQKGFDKYGRFP